MLNVQRSSDIKMYLVKLNLAHHTGDLNGFAVNHKVCIEVTFGIWKASHWNQ